MHLCGLANGRSPTDAVRQEPRGLKRSFSDSHNLLLMEDIGFGGPMRQVHYENTYITSPEGYGPNTKFERHKVYEVLVQMLKTHLEGQQYDPVKSSQISKMLADDLRESVRVSSCKPIALHVALATLGGSVPTQANKICVFMIDARSPDSLQCGC